MSDRSGPKTSQPNFPIDAVYTWVDGDDPEWRHALDSYLAAKEGREAPHHEASASASRFHNRDELLYSLRSLEMYAPYIRHVYIVTADQTPAWLDTEAPDVSLVSHRDIFPDPGDLPTFNSHSIEANLHRIEGLSEHFIYLNDDMLFSQPSQPSDFFDEKGRVKTYLDKRRVQRKRIHPHYRHPVHHAARNNSEFLEAKFGYRIVNRVDHVPYALRRSILEELWELIPERLAQTSASRIRGPEDLSVPSSLAHFYAHCTGRGHFETEIQSTYIKLKKGFFSQLRTWIQIQRFLKYPSTRRKFVSINDAGQLDVSERTTAAVDRFFEETFPEPSRFEKRGARGSWSA